MLLLHATTSCYYIMLLQRNRFQRQDDAMIQWVLVEEMTGRSDIWLNYSDLIVTSLESWLVREILPI